MLTQLPTFESRLAILETDTQYDDLMTTAIKAVSARFDRETRPSRVRKVPVARGIVLYNGTQGE